MRRQVLGGQRVSSGPAATTRPSRSSSTSVNAGRDLLDVVGDQHERRRVACPRRARRAGATRSSRPPRSRPAAGSSSSISSGSVISARAICTRLRSPSLSVPNVRSARCADPERGQQLVGAGVVERRRSCSRQRPTTPYDAVTTTSRTFSPAGQPLGDARRSPGRSAAAARRRRPRRAPHRAPRRRRSWGASARRRAAAASSCRRRSARGRPSARPPRPSQVTSSSSVLPPRTTLTPANSRTSLMGTDPRPRRVRRSVRDTYRGRRVRAFPPRCASPCGPPRRYAGRLRARGGDGPRACPIVDDVRAATLDRLGAAGATSASGVGPASRCRAPATSAACPRLGRRSIAAAHRGRRVRLVPGIGGALVPTRRSPSAREGDQGTQVTWTAYDAEPVPRARAGGAVAERAGPALPPGAGRADPPDRRPRRPAVVRQPRPGDGRPAASARRGVGAARGRCRQRAAGVLSTASVVSLGTELGLQHRLAGPRPAPPTSAAGCCSRRCWRAPTGAVATAATGRGAQHRRDAARPPTPDPAADGPDGRQSPADGSARATGRGRPRASGRRSSPRRSASTARGRPARPDRARPRPGR